MQGLEVGETRRCRGVQPLSHVTLNPRHGSVPGALLRWCLTGGETEAQRDLPPQVPQAQRGGAEAGSVGPCGHGPGPRQALPITPVRRLGQHEV